MKARFVRNKAKGQSIPLIALMIVVLVAMVGLAVDVGQTYAEQRNTQRATNAAALAGMNKLIGHNADSDVVQAVKSSLASNGIVVAKDETQVKPGERILKGFYLDASGDPLTGCETLGSNCTAEKLSGAKYIKVTVTGKVDTFFARVVGRNDLPVGANAWSARGVCLGIYPLGIRKSEIGATGFINPDPGAGGTYTDSNYRNRTVKTLNIYNPTTDTGSFVWARWAQDNTNTARGGNTTAAAAMMAGHGNITDGFNEAAWPSNVTDPPKPNGYPISPGQLSVGDWLLANSNPGTNSNTDLKTALNSHMDSTNRDVLILPIFDVAKGTGSSAVYHTTQLGAFLLLGYDLNAKTFKLAYVGDAPECSTLREPPKIPGNPSIKGPVLYRPRWKAQPTAAVAVQYEIILDVSGSMTWNYAGYGKKNGGTGSTVLCTGGNNGCSGTGTPWTPKEDRRIYFAKNAIKSFIDQMGTDDVMRIVTFSGGPFTSSPYTNARALSDFTDVYPSSWTGNKATLKSAVDSAGKQNNDIYLTEGRTPSAVGISRGSQELSSAPTKSPTTNVTYKRVVIFLTDGVANVRLNGTQPTYPNGCGTEIPSCNSGDDTMPINQAAAAASTLKQYAQVYVIAMAGVPETGLREIASQPTAPFYSTSQNGGDLTTIFDDINEDVREGDCVPLGGTDFFDTMKQNEIGTTTLGTLGYPTVGYVTLKDANGGTLPNGKGKAPIQMDQDGKLSYRIDDLTPGIYQMSAFVSYKGPDGVSHDYNQIYNKSTALTTTSQSIVVDASEALGTAVPIDPLHLDMVGGVCGK